jgi:hypothetical protein
VKGVGGGDAMDNPHGVPLAASTTTVGGRRTVSLTSFLLSSSCCGFNSPVELPVAN